MGASFWQNTLTEYNKPLKSFWSAFNESAVFFFFDCISASGRGRLQTHEYMTYWRFRIWNENNSCWYGAVEDGVALGPGNGVWDDGWEGVDCPLVPVRNIYLNCGPTAERLGRPAGSTTCNTRWEPSRAKLFFVVIVKCLVRRAFGRIFCGVFVPLLVKNVSECYWSAFPGFVSGWTLFTPIRKMHFCRSKPLPYSVAMNVCLSSKTKSFITNKVTSWIKSRSPVKMVMSLNARSFIWVDLAVA